MAQINTGTILDTVNDASGAVVPTAKVTALNEQTSLTRITPTSTGGSYLISLLSGDLGLCKNI
jgi:hypothetical protein